MSGCRNAGRSPLERVGPRGPGFSQEQQQPQIAMPLVFQNGMVPGVDLNPAMAARMAKTVDTPGDDDEPNGVDGPDGWNYGDGPAWWWLHAWLTWVPRDGCG